MATVDAEIEFQGNDDQYFIDHATDVPGVGIIIYHNDGRYKFGDNVTQIQNLPFRGTGGGVQSVTGDGVDNTDPLNPVMDLSDYTLDSDLEGYVKKGSITNNKILKGTGTDTATDSSITDNGTTVTADAAVVITGHLGVGASAIPSAQEFIQSDSSTYGKLVNGAFGQSHYAAFGAAAAQFYSSNPSLIGFYVDATMAATAIKRAFKADVTCTNTDSNIGFEADVRNGADNLAINVIAGDVKLQPLTALKILETDANKKLVSADYSVSEILNNLWSSGALSGFAFTNNGDGTANISTGQAMLRTSASATAELNEYALSAVTNQTFTDNTVNYIYANYNSGTPIISVTTDITQINTLTTTLMYSVVRVGTSLYYHSTIGQNVDANGKLRRRQLTIEKFAYGNGAIISNPTARKLALTAGNFFTGLTPLSTPAFNTNVSDTFTYVYYNGVNYTRTTGQTDIDNTNYINAGASTAMANNKFRADFVYLLIDNPTQLWVVQGDTQYLNLSAAKAAPLPTNLPPELLGLGQVVGRIIIEKSAIVLADVASNFTTSFTAGTATDHNQLGGLQGGTTNEYYHLTNTEHTKVQTSLKSYSVISEYWSNDFTTLANLSAFTITQPNSTWVLTGGYLRLTRADAAAGFSDHMEYNGFGSINSKYWTRSMEFYIKRLDATSSGLGFGFIADCVNNTTDTVRADLNCTSGAGKGTLTLRVNGATAVGATTKLTFSLNDKVKITITRNKNRFTATAQNFTAINTVAPVCEFTAITSRLASTGWSATQLKPQIYNLGGTYDVIRDTQGSKNWLRPDIITMGDSITHGMFTDNQSLAWPELIGEITGRKVLNFASQSTTTADWLNSTGEIIAHAPRYVYIAIGRNDLATAISQATILANYATIIGRFVAAGIDYRIVSVLPSNGIAGITSLNTALLAAYPTKFLDIYTYFNNGGNIKDQMDSGDGTHLWEHAHQEVAKRIVDLETTLQTSIN